MDDLIYDEISEHLFDVFGDLTGPEELPEAFLECKIEAMLLFYRGAVSTNGKKEAQKAILHLAGPGKQEFIRRQIEQPKTRLTFAQAVALLRYWAILVSSEFLAIVSAIVENNPSLLDDFVDGQKDDAERCAFALETAYNLKVCCEQAFGKSPVKRVAPAQIMSDTNMTTMVEQMRNPTPGSTAYRQSQHLHVRIDPNFDIASIIESVRELVGNHHEMNRDDFYHNWSEDEQKFWGKDHIESIAPWHDFTYKERGYKGESEQDFLDSSFRALLFWELLRQEKSVNIMRHFFGLKDKKKNAEDYRLDNYNALTTLAYRMKTDAKKLIQKALRGVGMQT